LERDDLFDGLRVEFRMPFFDRAIEAVSTYAVSAVMTLSTLGLVPSADLDLMSSETGLATSMIGLATVLYPSYSL